MTKNMTGNLFEVKKEETIQSKKDMILSLFNSGTTEIETISAISGAKPSYVGTVLQNAFGGQRLKGYAGLCSNEGANSGGIVQSPPAAARRPAPARLLSSGPCCCGR